MDDLSRALEGGRCQLETEQRKQVHVVDEH
jgi:hypothetical protein